jgi:hypothetical protein
VRDLLILSERSESKDYFRILSCIQDHVYVAIFVVLPGLVEKGIDFNVTRNAFIEKHESILQRSQAFRGSA